MKKKAYSNFIFFAILFIAQFLFSQKIYAATISSAQNGNWSDGATWIGGVVPGIGDTVIISTGHSIIANNNITIGTSSGSGSIALTVNGDLIVNEDVIFTVRGDVLVANGKTVALSNGSTWQFDSSLAAGVVYKLLLAGNGKLITNGNQAKRVTMKSAVGSGPWHIRYYQAAEGQVDANYTDF